LFGVRAVICMPGQASPVKGGSLRALGAEVACYGRDLDEARGHCEKQATGYGYRYIRSGNEPSPPLPPPPAIQLSFHAAALAAFT
jgi:threonine dehydratase